MGAGPRASQYLVLAAKARAVLFGRYYVSTDDIRAVAGPVLRHRIITNFNAEAEGLRPDDIVQRLTPRPSPSTITRTKVEDYQKFLNPQTLASLEGIDLQARLVVEGYVAGMHPSPYHGFSRRVRRSTVNTCRATTSATSTGRSGRRRDKLPILKQYEEETNLLLYLLLDTSESMAYAPRTRTCRSSSTPQFIAAALAYMTRSSNRTRSAWRTFDDKVQCYLKTASRCCSPSHLKEVFHLMDVSPPKRKTDMGQVLHDLAERFRKRGVIAIFSDFFDDVPRIVAGLKHFRHRRHEVIVFHILDPAEVDFPFRQTDSFQGSWKDCPTSLTEPHALAAGLSGRAPHVPGRPEEELPHGRHRLRALAHRRRAPRHGRCRVTSGVAAPRGSVEQEKGCGFIAVRDR